MAPFQVGPWTNNIDHYWPHVFSSRHDAVEHHRIYWFHNHTASLGPMRYREVATYDSQETTGPILLQQHGSAVLFRNIWVRDLKLEQPQSIEEKK